MDITTITNLQLLPKIKLLSIQVLRPKTKDNRTKRKSRAISWTILSSSCSSLIIRYLSINRIKLDLSPLCILAPIWVAFRECKMELHLQVHLSNPRTTTSLHKTSKVKIRKSTSKRRTAWAKREKCQATCLKNKSKWLNNSRCNGCSNRIKVHLEGKTSLIWLCSSNNRLKEVSDNPNNYSPSKIKHLQTLELLTSTEHLLVTKTANTEPPQACQVKEDRFNLSLNNKILTNLITWRIFQVRLIRIQDKLMEALTSQLWMPSNRWLLKMDKCHRIILTKIHTLRKVIISKIGKVWTVLALANLIRWIMVVWTHIRITSKLIIRVCLTQISIQTIILPRTPNQWWEWMEPSTSRVTTWQTQIQTGQIPDLTPTPSKGLQISIKRLLAWISWAISRSEIKPSKLRQNIQFSRINSKRFSSRCSLSKYSPVSNSSNINKTW